MKRILFLIALIIIILAVGRDRGYFQIKAPEPAKLIQLQSEESAVIAAVKKALPSVVTVSIQKTTVSGDTLQFNPFDPFAPFEIQPGKKQTIEQNIGSGFVIAANGVIITNRHVVADTEATYKVITNDHQTYPAQAILRDPLNDLAIIKVSATALPSLTLGNSNNLQLGQMAIAIGTPLGEFQNTVTTGVISGLGRGITAGSPLENYVEKLDNVIQTDAAINAGNSGGPLLNSVGEVVGINTAVSQEGQNIGFAIPASVIKELLDNYLASGGKISRPYLGIRYRILSEETAVMNDLPKGAYIVEVIKDSNAAKAGLVKGDVITKVNGKAITAENDITKIIKESRVGDRLNLEIWHQGKKSNQTVELGEFQ